MRPLLKAGDENKISNTYSEARKYFEMHQVSKGSLGLEEVQYLGLPQLYSQGWTSISSIWIQTSVWK